MAKVILTLSFIFVFAIFALGVPGWAIESIQNYQTSPWIEVILLLAILAYFFESLAECLAIWPGSRIKSSVVYASLFDVLDFSSFLFSIRGSLLAHLTI
jgi:hypothetical protein